VRTFQWMYSGLKSGMAGMFPSSTEDGKEETAVLSLTRPRHVAR
jgi:hypothetical protein